MLIPSRRILFGFALGGCLAGSAAIAQDGPLIIPTAGEPQTTPARTEQFLPPEPAFAEQFLPPAPEPAFTDQFLPPAPITLEIPVAASIPAIVRISDLPPDKQIGHPEYKPPSERRRIVSPNHGWTQPGRLPMHRSWVPYHKFFPNQWTGAKEETAPVRRPMVYMPTDTTQLGYYYQHVPHWHAYTGMVPPVPRPVDWHIPYVPPRIMTPPALPAPQMQPTPDLGDPSEIPAAPTETDLEKSARRPELIPIPR